MTTRRPFRVFVSNDRSIEIYAAGHLHNLRSVKPAWFVKDGNYSWMLKLGEKIYTNALRQNPYTSSRIIREDNTCYIGLANLFAAANQITVAEYKNMQERFRLYHAKRAYEHDKACLLSLAKQLGLELTQKQLSLLSKGKHHG